MKRRIAALALPLVAVAGPLFAPGALAADVQAGKAIATAVCAACHGANGVSVGAGYPNLAAQRAPYLVAQLAAFKAGTRKSDVMNVIAPQLSAEDIDNVAAHFAAQALAAPEAKSAVPPEIAKTRLTVPADFKTGYVQYLVRNDPESRQVELYYANDVAMAAAAAGRPLPDGARIFIAVHAATLDAAKNPVVGKDGKFVPGAPLAYTGMGRDTDWGKDFPPMLRNENWNYALFKADRSVRSDVNQAECLACHKPKASSSYLFLHDELVAAAKK